MVGPNEPSSGTELGSHSPRQRKALAVGLLVVLSAVLVGVYWLLLAGRGERGADARRSQLGPGQVYFVELVYEQHFAPVAGTELRPRARDRSLDGYVFRPDAATLHPCSLGVKQNPSCRLMIGRRLHFPYNRDPNVVQDLGYAQDGYESWAVDLAPTPDDILMYGPTCWLRLPVRVKAAMGGDRCVVSVGDMTVTLATGEQKEVWSAQRPYTASEYADAIASLVNATQEKPVEIPADILKARLPVDAAGKLTLYARLLAVYHGPVSLSPVHLVKERNAGIQALHAGEYDSAISHLDSYLRVIQDDEVARDMRDRAATGKEQNIKVHRLYGTVTLPAGAAPSNPRSWIGIRQPDDPQDHSRDLSGVKDGNFEFRVAAGTYIVTAYIPGFRPVSRTVQVEGDTRLQVQLTEADGNR